MQTCLYWHAYVSRFNLNPFYFFLVLDKSKRDKEKSINNSRGKGKQRSSRIIRQDKHTER